MSDLDIGLMQFIRIPYLEDNISDRQLVARALKADGLQCELNCVKARQEFDKALEAGGFDLISDRRYLQST